MLVEDTEYLIAGRPKGYKRLTILYDTRDFNDVIE